LEEKMITFKIKKEEDLKKIQARNIEPIKITKTDSGWDVEVEEDVNIDGIISPPDAVSVPKKEEKVEKKAEKKAEKKKKKKKK